MKHLATVLLLLLVGASPLWAAETKAPESEIEKVNYSVGYQIGGDFMRQGIEAAPDQLVQGILDALSGGEAKMTLAEMNSTLVALKQKIVAEQQQKQQQALEQYRGEGRDYLAANAKKEGVVVLPSGLQYKVLKSGDGKSPGPHDEVKVNYRGTLIGGQEFDSSFRRGEPATFQVDGVIKGWTEALQMMHEGDSWMLYVPADLAYGEHGPLAEKTLIFEVELLEVHPASQG